MPEHTLSLTRRNGVQAILTTRRPSRPLLLSRAPLLRLSLLSLTVSFVLPALVRASAESPPGPTGHPFQSHHVQLSFPDDAIDIQTTGGDPYLIWKWKQPLGPEQFVVSFEYFSPQEIDQVSAYLGPPITEATRVGLPNVPLAEGWQEYAAELTGAGETRLSPDIRMLRLDFGTRSDIRLRIRNLKIRARTRQELDVAADAERKRNAKRAIDQRIRDYLSRSFPMRFRHVIVDKDTVRLAGSVSESFDDPESLRLVEFPSYLSIDEPGIVIDTSVTVSEDGFSVRVPRIAKGRDRRFSGWRLGHTSDGQIQFLTSRFYATELSVGLSDHATQRPVPTSQKGLSGFSTRGPREDLPQLGIDAVTLNLVLNRFLASTPGQGRERIDVEGPATYFNHAAFDGFDPLVEFARRHEIVVTAIVLIPRSRQSNRQSPLVHPESNGGVYAMPDLVTERGAKIYEVVLDRIAKRYSNTDRKPGGITNWVAHNEIDFHPVWTNMGLQPRSICTETYYRSMRMIHNAARTYNPHARVFVSLTHHWHVPDDEKWRQLSPKETLETLQQYARMEGEFAWGIAYHPYPQSLFAPVAWNDTNIRNDYDTPLITIQNLQVLGNFLAQPEMLDAHGKRRPVLLSEQGFHTDSYESSDQNRQAGSLHYAMSKIKTMPWIESFHYHRWIDHPDEGGLMLGLRTLPTAEHRHGIRKRSWYVYQAIGTDDEAKVTRDLPRPGSPSVD